MDCRVSVASTGVTALDLKQKEVGRLIVGRDAESEIVGTLERWQVERSGKNLRTLAGTASARMRSPKVDDLWAKIALKSEAQESGAAWKRALITWDLRKLGGKNTPLPPVKNA